MSVELFKAKYRLRWQYEGKRYSLATGQREGSIGADFSRDLANRIERDCYEGLFDKTLDKYRLYTEKKNEGYKELTVLWGWDLFVESKKKTVQSTTFQIYHYLGKRVKEFFKETELIKNVGEDRAIQYLKRYEDRRSLATSKDDFVLLGGCWHFFIRRGYTTHNPWKELASQMKPLKNFHQSPFTKDEIDAILTTAQASDKYKYYYPLFAFLFSTGCRIGEALGLTWNKLNYPLGSNSRRIPTSVRIEQALSRKGMKGTKTGKPRIVPIPEKLGILLESLKTPETKPDDIIFPAKRGRPQSDRTVSAVVWTPLLKEAGVPHRKLYNTRHTFVSHALENGASPVNVAKITGHSTKVMFEHYAGSISKMEMPDLI